MHPFGGPPKGCSLDGRYLLDRRIATGGMGEVWRGRDQTLGRPVAVKLLRPEYASDESFLVRFRGEARHAARVSHPGVASVYDYGEVIGDDAHPTAYLVMELVEGEPLSALLHREKRLSPEKTLDILGQAADALQAAHALGVVHRDIKPGNLLLRTDGAVKVTDFGIARAVDAAPLTATGIMMGTAYYVSPEQASGRPVTPASDVYSLGVVAYECLAGRRPFDDRNPIVVVMAHQQDEPPPLPPDIPEPVRGLVQAAMAKDPTRRPASAGSFGRTAAAIRRNLWNAEATRRGVAPGAVPRTDADAVTRHPGPTGIPAGPDAVTGTPARDRPPPWTRQPSWAAGSPQEIRARWDAQLGTPPAADISRPDVGPLPGGRAARRRANGGQAASPAPGRRKLPLPVLIFLLIVTTAAAALITRIIAETDGSVTSAPPPAGAVYMPRTGDGIVTEDSATGNNRVMGDRMADGTGTATGPIRSGVRGQSAGTGPGKRKGEHGWQA
jgi:serine/threonine-protein kinase